MDDAKKPKPAACPELTGPVVVEFIGTFFLCLTISLSGSSYMGPLAIGGMLMAMVFMGGEISGAHFNPAVTLAVALCAKCDWMKAIYYICAQFAASFCAGVVGGVISKGEGQMGGYPSVAPGRYLSALLCEFLFTFILAKVVLHVTKTKLKKHNAFFGMAIGLTVFSGAVSVGGISGAAFNPAVGTGLPFVQGSFWDFWVYWIGPSLGGVAAAFVFWATNDDEKFILGPWMPMHSQTLKDIAPFLMEGIGTFFLCFVYSLSTSSLLGPLAVGAVLVALVFMSGHVSGSHYNPAVTGAIVSTGAMEMKTGLYYIASQLIGSILAGLFARLLAGSSMGYPGVQGGAAALPAAILLEMLVSFALVLTVFHTAVREACENSYYGLAIGMVVFAGASIASPISGGAFNPALGTGLPLCALSFFDIWLYWVAPFVGGVAAAGVYMFTQKPQEEFKPVGEP